jgi:hypothetical protein
MSGKIADIFKGRLVWAAGLVLGVVVGLAIAFATASGADTDDSDARLGEDPGIAPAEYLYLDNARVLTYLSQMAGGLRESEERSITQTRSLEAGVENGGFKAGGSAQKQSFVKQVVTPTATSNYFRLLDGLQDRAEHEGRIVEVSAAELADKVWRKIGEGSFVKVTGVRLTLPKYAADYFFLRRSGSPRLRRFGNLADTFELDTRQMRRINWWLGRFGKNPRITFNFEVPRRGGPVRMLVPAQYGALADEQSLITGGSLTLVGKVVRKVDAPDDSFVDAQTLGLFAPALGAMPRFLIRRKRAAERGYSRALRRGSRHLDAAPELRAPPRERLKHARQAKTEMTSRDNLLRNLKDSTRLDRAGLVVIPVAIYK